MKSGKAVGTSLIVAEMLKASGAEGAQQIRDLIEDIIHSGKIPTECEESIIISFYKGKGVALECGDYRGLKLLDQVMKVLERVAENFLWQQVCIDNMQFGFMPGRSTTDAIFIVSQLQEKFHAVNKTMYMAFVDPQKGIWSCTQTCHLVSSSQAQRWGVAGAAHTEHVWKCQKQSMCWLQPEWWVQCESGCTLRFLLEPLTVHHGSGSPFQRISLRMSLGDITKCIRLVIHNHISTFKWSHCNQSLFFCFYMITQFQISKIDKITLNTKFQHIMWYLNGNF